MELQQNKQTMQYSKLLNLWRILLVFKTLLHVEGGEYLVEVEVEVPAIFA
jgi:hypothetical protein